MVIEKSQKLQEVFHDKNYLAKLYQEKYDIQLEYNHLKTLTNNNVLSISNKKISLDNLMKFWHEYQDIMDGIKKAGILYRLYYRLFLGINIGALMKEKTSTVINSIQYMVFEKK